MPDATIASFILRFTQEHPGRADPRGGAWRGVIRHVQSDDETRFTRVEEALAFIARYVDLTGDRRESLPEE